MERSATLPTPLRDSDPDGFGYAESPDAVKTPKDGTKRTSARKAKISNGWCCSSSYYTSVSITTKVPNAVRASLLIVVYGVVDGDFQQLGLAPDDCGSC